MRPAFDEARVRIEEELCALSGEGLLERLRAVDDTVASVMGGPELELRLAVRFPETPSPAA